MSRPMMGIPILLALIASGMATPVSQYVKTGTEEYFWEHSSVIVGRVQSTSKLPSGRGVMQLEVLGVLVTDVLVTHVIEVQYPIGEFRNPYADFAPKQGDVYAMCIKQGGSETLVWSLPGVQLTFMETRTAIMPVEGVQDEKVRKLAERLLDVRHKYFINMYGQKSG